MFMPNENYKPGNNHLESKKPRLSFLYECKYQFYKDSEAAKELRLRKNQADQILKEVQSYPSKKLQYDYDILVGKVEEHPYAKISVGGKPKDIKQAIQERKEYAREKADDLAKAYRLRNKEGKEISTHSESSDKKFNEIAELYEKFEKLHNQFARLEERLDEKREEVFFTDASWALERMQKACNEVTMALHPEDPQVLRESDPKKFQEKIERKIDAVAGDFLKIFRELEERKRQLDNKIKECSSEKEIKIFIVIDGFYKLYSNYQSTRADLEVVQNEIGNREIYYEEQSEASLKQAQELYEFDKKERERTRTEQWGINYNRIAEEFQNLIKKYQDQSLDSQAKPSIEDLNNKHHELLQATTISEHGNEVIALMNESIKTNFTGSNRERKRLLLEMRIFYGTYQTTVAKRRAFVQRLAEQLQPILDEAWQPRPRRNQDVAE